MLKLLPTVLLLFCSCVQIFADAEFDQKIKPFLETYCYRCHDEDKQKGDVNFKLFESRQDMLKEHEMWRLAVELVHEGEMPTRGDQPNAEEMEHFAEAVEDMLEMDWKKVQRPGHVTLSRLSNTQYDNSIRDLTGLDLKPSKNFPKDDTGPSGFNNDHDALFMSGNQMEKYFDAADHILDNIVDNEKAKTRKPLALKVEAKTMHVTDEVDNKEDWGYSLKVQQHTIYKAINFPVDGYYGFAIRAAGLAKPLMKVRLDGKELKDFEVEAFDKDFESYKFKAYVEKGLREFRINMKFRKLDKKEKSELSKEIKDKGIQVGKNLFRLNVDSFLVKQLSKPKSKPSPIFNSKSPTTILRQLATKAYRRPVTQSEMTYLLGLYKKSRSKDTYKRLRLPMKAILTSPDFLYHIEEQPKEGQRKLSDFELASRLSYFLWMSTPDSTLMNLAAKKELSKPAVLKAQIKRMIASSKHKVMAKNFARQWLGIEELGISAQPDPDQFPEFTEELQKAMIQETETFFTALMQNDQSFELLIDAPYTYLNETLAKHYQIPGVEGNKFRKVEFPNNNRGGVLGMGSVLTVSSTSLRTSPVIRGMWILERLLGRELLPPPADAGEIAEDAGNDPNGKSLREILAEHRDKPDCKSCHKKIDPMGFGLENFDAIGRFRLVENGRKIDSSGQLPSGVSFNGLKELKPVLKKDFADEYSRNVVKQMLSFALGRKLEFYDEYTIQSIQQKFQESGLKPSVLITEIAMSLPFNYIERNKELDHES